MSRAASQPDLFTPPQADLFAGEPAPERERRSYSPSPGYVRAYLRKIVGEAREAAAMPWDARKAGFYRQVVPQMVLWLPDEEAAQWRLDFEREMERLEGAAEPLNDG